MGKSRRKRSERERERVRQRQEAARRVARRKRRVRTASIGTAVVVGGAAVVMAIVLTVGAVADSGFFLRNKPSLSTGRYEVTNAMLSYRVMAMAAEESSGPDRTKPLSGQTRSDGDDWFDYLLAQAKDEAAQFLVLAEKATAEGVVLEAAETGGIDKQIAGLKSAAESGGMKYEAYLAREYGRGVKEADIRAYEELSALAAKYAESVWDSLAFTGDDINEYYEDNETDFLYADYLSYTVTAASTEDADMEAAKTVADGLAAQKSEDAFKKAVKEYLLTLEEDGEKSHTEETAAAAAEKLYTELYAYTDETDLGAWMFDDERAAGDTRVVEGSGLYTVYYVAKTAYRNERPASVDVRHILMKYTEYDSEEAAKAEAERVYALWKEGGADEAGFAALANEHSDDVSADNPTGGLYEDVAKGDMVDTFDAWCFDSQRKPGDHDLITTDYGYHIMYFAGAEGPAWEVSVTNALKNEAYGILYEEWEAAYVVTTDSGKLGKLSV